LIKPLVLKAQSVNVLASRYDEGKPLHCVDWMALQH